ncbi:hypothetical protein BH20ACI4_BH20ACI4_29090 [soil metagenome]
MNIPNENSGTTDRLEANFDRGLKENGIKLPDKPVTVIEPR